MGIRTVFNILGPLTNPAGANAQVLGVYREDLVKPLAYVLKKLDCEEAMGVHGIGGLDEISIIGETSLAWLRDGKVIMTRIKPNDFGFSLVDPQEIEVKTPEESVDLTFKILNDILDVQNPMRIVVLLNAAAGIVVSGKADNLVNGIELAAESIESGAAYKKLREMIKSSDGELVKLEELETEHKADALMKALKISEGS